MGCSGSQIQLAGRRGFEAYHTIPRSGVAADEESHRKMWSGGTTVVTDKKETFKNRERNKRRGCRGDGAKKEEWKEKEVAEKSVRRKRSSEAMEILWWAGFINDGAGPLSSSSSNSALALVTGLKPRKHTKHMSAVSHTHAHSSLLALVFLTEIEVTSQLSHLKSIHVAPSAISAHKHT